MKPKVVVLGAGVAGLSTALHLLKTGEFDVAVVEKSDRVGGLASSYKMGPATFDFGPHAFHSQQPHIIQFFQDLMKGEYFEIDKNVAIKFQDRLYPYPLNPAKALQNMPITSSVRCGLSYGWNLLTNHRSLGKLRSAEEFFVRNFGWELYRIFFEGYTHKVWGIHPRELSVEFIKNRLPPAGLLRIAWFALTGKDLKVRKPNEVPLKLRIFYPKQGSLQFPQTMAQEIERLGGAMHLQTTLESVEWEKGKARSVTVKNSGGEHRWECQTVVSTIPLPDLVRSLRPAVPPKILESAKKLSFRPILIACLWIQKPQIFPQQTIYYTNRIFNRLAQMNSYSQETTPAGTCGITAELTCRVEDPLWKMDEKELLKKVIMDMEKEGLISAADVKDGMVLRSAHGYPVYQLQFEEHLQALRETIHDIPNLIIAGRQGMFNYAQMHYGVQAGMLIADHLLKGSAKPSLSGQQTEEAFFA